MTDTPPTADAVTPARPDPGPITEPPAPHVRRGLDALELDKRFLGMVGAFALICLAFQLWTGLRVSPPGAGPLGWLTNGSFLTPRNIFNLTVQTVSVAIMATGMVFVIVMRHIDLSVGSLLGTCSAAMAMMQTVVLPQWMGLGLGSDLIAPLAIVSGLVVGAAVGALHGWLIGYMMVPAFIVTLGGLLVWRNVAWHLSGGQTIGPLDANFQLFGGTGGTIGETASWVVAGLAVAATWGAMVIGRRRRIRFGFPIKPLWAEATMGSLFAGLILGFVAVINAYEIPVRRLQREFEARGEVMPEGYTEAFGLPISVLLLAVVAIVMMVIATRTRFGRYIYATGGNPEATQLAGVNTRMLTVKVFALMGVLCALAALVASARLTFHSNDVGTLDELRVIAAAVIGGTALSGGLGTIYGAILGAVVMQSLQSGMAMVGVEAPYQNMVVGAVLVLAVLVDIIYRRRSGERI